MRLWTTLPIWVARLNPSVLCDYVLCGLRGGYAPFFVSLANLHIEREMEDRTCVVEKYTVPVEKEEPPK
jgi:hypothetical protein